MEEIYCLWYNYSNNLQKQLLPIIQAYCKPTNFKKGDIANFEQMTLLNLTKQPNLS